MKFARNILIFSLIAAVTASCGKLRPQVMTPEKLKMGSPKIDPGTISFSVSAPAFPGPDPQTYPIVNQGYRTATINAITIGGVDAAQFAINLSSTCIVGYEIKAAEYCFIDIDYTPGSRPSTADATLTIDYSGAGSSYSVEFLLDGTAY